MFTRRKSGQATGAGEAGGSDERRRALDSGARAEDLALAYLQEQGLRLVQRNYRVARGPSQRGGEIDLILRDRDGTLVFVEVRARSDAAHGGGAASVTASKRAKLIRAAQYFLLRWPELPPCRFDVVAIDGGAVHWLPAAFDAA